MEECRRPPPNGRSNCVRSASGACRLEVWDVRNPRRARVAGLGGLFFIFYKSSLVSLRARPRLRADWSGHAVLPRRLGAGLDLFEEFVRVRAERSPDGGGGRGHKAGGDRVYRSTKRSRRPSATEFQRGLSPTPSRPTRRVRNYSGIAATRWLSFGQSLAVATRGTPPGAIPACSMSSA